MIQGHLNVLKRHPIWKNPMYIDKLQRAVKGHAISLIMAWPSRGNGYFKAHILYCLSIRYL